MTLTRLYLTGTASQGVLSAASHWAQLRKEQGDEAFRRVLMVAPSSVARGDTMTLDNGQVVTAGVPYRRERA